MLLLVACSQGSDQRVAPTRSGPIPETDLLLAIHCPEEVDFGKAFSLQVQRVWRRDLSPDEWQDRHLAPLRLRLLDRSLREDAERMEEWLSYDAFLFERESLQIPSVTFSARNAAGVAAVQVQSEARGIKPRLSIDADSEVNAELPGGLMSPPADNRFLLGSVLAVLALFSIVVWSFWRGSRSQTTIAGEKRLTPRERASRRIEALRKEDPQDLPAIRAFHMEASAVLRSYIEAAHSLPAPERTTEELLASLRSNDLLDSKRRDLLEDFLACCDRVKFAQGQAGEKARAELLDAADLFLQEKDRA
jgi:hypothetical protein